MIFVLKEKWIILTHTMYCCYCYKCCFCAPGRRVLCTDVQYGGVLCHERSGGVLWFSSGIFRKILWSVSVLRGKDSIAPPACFLLSKLKLRPSGCDSCIDMSTESLLASTASAFWTRSGEIELMARRPCESGSNRST